MDYIKHIIAQQERSISDEDAKALEIWKSASNDNTKEYKQIVATWQKTGSFNLDFAKEKIEARAFLKEHMDSPKVKKMQFWKMAIAASFLLLVFNFGWKYWINKDANVDLIVQEYTTSSSSESFILPDKSTIILGSNSKLSYNNSFNSTDRNITLKGSLFVDVTKNKALPFVVHAEGFDVRVLGTAFQISALDKNNIAKVSVLRGLVEVATNNMKVQLKPNEAVSVNTITKTIEPIMFQTNDIAPFTEPLIFENTPMMEVAKKLESKFHVTIKLIQTLTSGCKFTGKFSRQDLDGIMLIIKKATNMKLQKISNSTYIWTVIPC